MKTIKAKNGEWVNLSNHLPTLAKIEGKVFAVAVAANITILRNSLKHLEGILAPSPELSKLSEEAKVYEGKTDKKSLAAMKKIEDNNPDVIKERQEQIETANKTLGEEYELELEQITEEMYPENISAEQILGLQILK